MKVRVLEDVPNLVISENCQFIKNYIKNLVFTGIPSIKGWSPVSSPKRYEISLYHLAAQEESSIKEVRDNQGKALMVQYNPYISDPFSWCNTSILMQYQYLFFLHPMCFLWHMDLYTVFPLVHGLSQMHFLWGMDLLQCFSFGTLTFSNVLPLGHGPSPLFFLWCMDLLQGASFGAWTFSSEL